MNLVERFSKIDEDENTLDDISGDEVSSNKCPFVWSFNQKW